MFNWKREKAVCTIFYSLRDKEQPCEIGHGKTDNWDPTDWNIIHRVVSLA